MTTLNYPDAGAGSALIGLNPAINGTFNAATVNTDGSLNVTVVSGGGGGGGGTTTVSTPSASNTGGAVPAQADYIGFSVGGSLTGVSATSPLPTTTTGTVTTIPSATPQTVTGTITTIPAAAAQTVQGTVTASPTGTQTVAGTLALSTGNTLAVSGIAGTVTTSPTGTQTVAGSVSLLGTSAVSGVVSLAAGAANIGMIAGSSTNIPTYLQAVASGGVAMGSNSYLNAASSAVPTSVKASAGMIYGYQVANGGTSAVFFRLFNASAAPTVGTSAPTLRVVVPAGATVSFETPIGLAFGTGIAFDVTTGSLADNDTTTIAAAGTVAVNIFYK